MGTVTKEILIGVLISVAATISGAFIYIEFFSKYEFQETLRVMKEQELYGKVLTLSAIPNLFVFFILTFLIRNALAFSICKRYDRLLIFDLSNPQKMACDISRCTIQFTRCQQFLALHLYGSLNNPIQGRCNSRWP